MLDDHVALRQGGKPRQRPGRAVGDQAGQFQAPGRGVNRPDLGDVVIRVELRRLQHLARRISRRQLAGIEQSGLHDVVHVPERQQPGLHGFGTLDVAIGSMDSAPSDRPPQNSWRRLSMRSSVPWSSRIAGSGGTSGRKGDLTARPAPARPRVPPALACRAGNRRIPSPIASAAPGRPVPHARAGSRRAPTCP